MPKVIKVIGLLTAFLVFSFKSFAVLDVLDVDFKASYVTSTNMDSNVEHKEDGLLFGAEMGLGFYFPLLSSISVGVDYHNMNFKYQDNSSTIKTNMFIFGVNYNVLGIIPFINPYVSAGLAFDLNDGMFEGGIFQESLAEPVQDSLYKTNFMNYMLAGGVEIDGLTMFIPVIPYVEYRAYLIGMELYNVGREKIGNDSTLVQSVVFGLQYRF